MGKIPTAGGKGSFPDLETNIKKKEFSTGEVQGLKQEDLGQQSR